MKEVHDLIDDIIQTAASEGGEGREDYSLDLIQLQNELREKYAALQQQLAAAHNELREMTADRDSWMDQASERVKDWSEANAQLAAAREALTKMTADRDNWCEQAADRIDAWHEVRKELLETREALQAAEADAARYRWLKARSWGDSGSYYFTGPKYSGDMNLDAAIDATLQRDRQP